MNYFKEVEGLPVSLISERVKFTPAAGAVNASPTVQDTKTGTTTVGIIGKDCVVLAADQRAVMGHIADKGVVKVYPLTDYVGVTIAGTVGDSLALIRFLRAQANLYEIERETKITPNALASLLSNVLNNNRYYPFIFQPILGGMNSAPELFEITPYGGIMKKDDYAITGSGTTFAMTTLDQDYKKDLSEIDAIALAVKAVSAAKNRDIYSGGESVTVIVFDKNGHRTINRKEIDKVISKIKFN
ncbi:MAG: proteasome subunit beta [Candidatus Diapherotrites archaeon]|jgi:proteasome beta subunit|uniref:proteasome endopeptidase complex n=1 Tax=Candidatus Iainarchaeum sp. TaxID=3101447 RepID=A0A8T5GEB8_9ARCH|nr:proteasome subunit beta [Candidatus Diapherotrites archaeon]MBT7241501.1 proteasome subunit beta [Candidatus Diapherotrites archaeon]